MSEWVYVSEEECCRVLSSDVERGGGRGGTNLRRNMEGSRILNTHMRASMNVPHKYFKCTYSDLTSGRGRGDGMTEKMTVGDGMTEKMTREINWSCCTCTVGRTASENERTANTGISKWGRLPRGSACRYMCSTDADSGARSGSSDTVNRVQ